MHGSNLYVWAEGLTAETATSVLTAAAQKHPMAFTNYNEIGKQWAKVLGLRGYNSLCPYAQQFLATEYLKDHSPS